MTRGKPQTLIDEKARLDAIRAAAKGSGWGAKQGVLFRQEGDWFLAVHLRRRASDAPATHLAELLAKPMALDPLLWEVLGLPENTAQPLSFRYWGVFVCAAPLLASRTISGSGPDGTARAMLAAANDMIPEAMARLAAERFSDIARTSDGTDGQWRMAETILHALRLEGDEAAALAMARAGPSTISISGLVDDGLRAGRDHNAIFLAMQADDAPPPPPARMPGFWQRLFGG